MTNRPDLFTNVHKGIRRALFETSISLGKAPGGVVPAPLRTQVRGVLHFVRHHGENEDILLLPMLAETAPAVQQRMRQAHAEIESALHALESTLDHDDAAELYHRICDFAARYLDHMREEELELEPQIRAVLSAEQIQEFGRGSVARTAAEDARAMLSWMLAAMRPNDASELIARLPQALQSELGAFALSSSE
jgi:hemerythrin-like domain-containing protein